MTTTTTTGPALLRSVPTSATPSPRAARVTTPGAEETAGERLAMCARATDEAAAMAEHGIEQLRAVRLVLLGGQRAGSAGGAEEITARVMTELRALALVLGELHGELDELADHNGPEGA